MNFAEVITQKVYLFHKALLISCLFSKKADYQLHNHIQEHLAEQQTGNAKPYVFVYGIGSMFPYLRANVFLTCMEQFNQVNQYKIILFYPGESKGNSYSLFGRLDDMHAYRGTLLNYSESNN